MKLLSYLCIMEEKNILRPFKQIPEYQNEDTFEINGEELRAIEDMAKAYSRFIKVMEGMLIRQLDTGKIKIIYRDLDGNELTKEDIQEMFQEYARQTNQNSEPEI